MTTVEPQTRKEHRAATTRTGGRGKPKSRRSELREGFGRIAAATKKARAEWGGQLEPGGPGGDGWDLPGGGKTTWMDLPKEWRGTSVQVCGLYPWVAGSGSPIEGAPLGPHLEKVGQVVCGDPISYFLAGIIPTPTCFVMGQPSVGKSSLISKMLVLGGNWGYTPVVMSDTRPDFDNAIVAMGGEVIRLGPGGDSINPLDPGPVAAYWDLLTEQQQDEVADTVREGRLNLVEGLLEIARGDRLTDVETGALGIAIDILDEEFDGVPVMEDLGAVLRGRPERLQEYFHDRGEESRYYDAVEPLLRSLSALHARFQGTFSQQTTKQMPLDRPVDFDLSGIPMASQRLMAAVQLTTWGYVATVIKSCSYLVSIGILEDHKWLMVGDELHRPMRAVPALVFRIDTIIRMIRALDSGIILCTHTMDDLKFADPAIQGAALKLLEHADLKFLGGLSKNELGNLEELWKLSSKERRYITSWADKRTSGRSGGSSHKGKGKFLIKLGESPGIPFHAIRTPAEAELKDTNSAWERLRAARFGGETVEVVEDPSDVIEDDPELVAEVEAERAAREQGER